MKWISWSLFVLGLWILITALMSNFNWAGIVCGVAIAVLSIIGAVRS